MTSRRPSGVFRIDHDIRRGAAAPRSTFVGREVEVAAIEEHFARGARVVTLFGAGGIGKSRLAAAVATRHGRQTPIVHLADIATGQGVVDAIADVLGLRALAGGAERVDDVGARLAAMKVGLCVLDEADASVERLADVIEALSTQSPTTRWLVTSRELLRLPGEVAFEVGPLRVPANVDDTDAEAMRLFLDRASLGGRQRRPQELVDVVAVLQGIDGIPLAIELAAGCLDVMTLAELRARLPRQLDAYSTRDRSLPARMRTLRAVIETSWQRLTDAERSVLAQCTLFRGAFVLDWAEQVVKLDDASPGASVADALASLRSRSRVGSSHCRGAPRSAPLRLLQSVRLFAAEHLEAAAREATERRYVQCFVELARAASTASTNVSAWDDHVHDALADLSTAHALALRLDPAGATRLALAMIPAIRMHQGPGPAIAIVDTTLAGIPPGLPRARLLAERAKLHRVAGAHSASHADAEGAATLSLDEGDEASRGIALGLLAQLASTAEGVRNNLPEALGSIERSGDLRALAETLCGSAAALSNHASDGESWTLLRRATELSARLGFVTLEAQCASMEGIRLWTLARLEEALPRERHALELAMACGDRRCEAIARTTIAAIRQEQGDWDVALDGYDAARASLRQLGYRNNEAWATAYSAMLIHEQGDLARARDRYTEALDALDGGGWSVFANVVRAGLAAVLADLGDFVGAEAQHATAREPLKDCTPFDRVCALRGGHLVLARAARVGDPETKTALLDEVAALVAQTPEDFPHADVRCARRVLARAYARRRATHEAALLRVGSGGAWFALGSEARVPLGRRHLLRRLLLTLAEHQAARPGVPLDTQTLVAMAWPGERASAEALAPRMRVAINRLRSLGLRWHLVTSPGAYGLDPSLRVEIVRGPGDAAPRARREATSR